MISEDDFQFFADYAIFRPSGHLSLDEAIALVSEAISFAASRGIPRLLADTTGLTGFPSPSTLQRFEMAEQWAAASRGLRLVVVARPELIDPSRFGVTVARNRGLTANVFASAPEAIEWLLHPNPP